MTTSLLLALLLLICQSSIFASKNSGPHVAVCIAGQQGRLILESSFQHLFLPNTDVSFTLFYSLQQGHSHSFGSSSQPSPLANFSSSRLADHIKGIYLQNTERSRHIIVGSVIQAPLVGYKGWEDRLSMNFTNPSHHQVFTHKKHRPLTPSILEMYGHQVECAREIIRYENHAYGKLKEQGIFDYVLLLREDLYLFENIHLKHIFTNYFTGPRKMSKEKSLFPLVNYESLYSNSQLFEQYQEQFASESKSSGPKLCQFLSKNCLKSVNGVNPRFELYEREFGLSVLQSRISYFKFMVNHGVQVANPEQFDFTHAKNLHGNLCEADSTVLPVTVARLKEGSYCFEKHDVMIGSDHCFPSGQEQFVISHLC